MFFLGGESHVFRYNIYKHDTPAKTLYMRRFILLTVIAFYLTIVKLNFKILLLLNNLVHNLKLLLNHLF